MLLPIALEISDGCVAGGYAAWVEGITNDYSDIDIFSEVTNQQNERSSDRYNLQHVRSITENGAYQYIECQFHSWVNKSAMVNKMQFIMNVLKTFDIDECRVAYFLNDETKKVMYIRYHEIYKTKNIVDMSHWRMTKYVKRSKKVHSLKWLSMIKVKENYNNDDISKFINKINIQF